MRSKNADLSHRISVLEHGNLRFLLMDSPSDGTISEYVDLLSRHDVQLVVRACEPSYDSSPFLEAGFRFQELDFPDGQPPPPEVVLTWLRCLDEVFRPTRPDSRTAAVAVHCVAGLGRTPALVAVALIEKGMAPLDAVELVRSKRRGAINLRQLEFLENYKRRNSRQKCLIQ